MKRDFYIKDGKLYLRDAGMPGGPPGPVSRLFAQKKDLFFIRTADALFTFERDEKGNVARCLENFQGRPIMYEKKTGTEK